MPVEPGFISYRSSVSLVFFLLLVLPLNMLESLLSVITKTLHPSSSTLYSSSAICYNLYPIPSSVFLTHHTPDSGPPPH